jgi:serine/threonine protein kinase
MGEVWGSPIYMSPEQCMGGQLDQRADIYSLGIVMYEALTGEVPFFGKNYVETMSKQIGEPARPPSQMNPNVKIPEKLERVIMRSLEKEPNKRYQRVEEMLDDLHKSVETPKKKPAPPPEPAIRPAAKEKRPSKKDLATTLPDITESHPPAAARTSGEWQSFDPKGENNINLRDSQMRRSQENMQPAQRRDSEEINREFTRDSMRTSHTRARAYGTGDPRQSGSRYSRIRYEEKPTFTGLVVKALLIALFLGLSLGVVTMGVFFYSAVKSAHPNLPVIKLDESEQIKLDDKQGGEKGAPGSKNR